MSDDKPGRMKISVIIFTSCLLFIFAAGCGRSDYSVTTYEFTKNGHIIEHIVEDFPEDKYDVNDWESEIRGVIEEYDAKNKDAIRLTDVRCEEGVLRCSVDYEDDDAYYYLNEQPLFYGTVAAALKAGYSLMTPVYDADDGQSMESTGLKSMSETEIVIMNGDTDTQVGVTVPGRIICTTGNVTVGDKKKEAVVTDDNTCYIVFE